MGSKKIAILGAGKIGRPIGRHWLAAGHEVVFGSRRPERLTDLGGVKAAGFAEAAASAEVVLLSVPYPALAELLETAGGALDGKIVVDATNPMGLSAEGHIISLLDPGVTQGRATADRLPGARVARAFTHVMDELLWSRGTQQRDFWGMAYAADDPGTGEVVAGLISDAGFTPVGLGGLDDSAALDPGGPVFPHLFTPADLRVAAGLVTAASR